jgi:hypothetical protein
MSLASSKLHGMLRKLRSSKGMEQDACEEKDTQLLRIL